MSLFFKWGDGIVKKVGFMDRMNILRVVYSVALATCFAGSAVAEGTETIVIGGGVATNISANFSAKIGYKEGGAIEHKGTNTVITGYFEGNSVLQDPDPSGSKYQLYGGAIYNSGTITLIEGGFTNNYIRQNSYPAKGGAIYNTKGGYAGVIKEIRANFVGNTLDSKASYGGAIRNTEMIGSITGDFIANKAIGPRDAHGGAVRNRGTIGNIEGDFIGNSASSATNATGGAISNQGSIGLLAQNKSIEITGNSVTGPDGATRFEGISNSNEDKEVPQAVINFNVFKGNNITVNDAISGSVDKVATQILNVNSGLDGAGNAVVFNNKGPGVVIFNNKVENQTLAVHGGTLKLGSYKGGPVSAYNDSITTENAIASLINSKLSVSTNALLKIDSEGVQFTQVDVTNNGEIQLDKNSSLLVGIDTTFLFGENATLVASSGSEILLSLDGIDLVPTEDEDVFTFEHTFITAANDTDATELLDMLDQLVVKYDGAELDRLGEGNNPNWGWELKAVDNEVKVVGTIPEPAVFSLIGLMGSALLFIRRRFF